MKLFKPTSIDGSIALRLSDLIMAGMICLIPKAAKEGPITSDPYFELLGVKSWNVDFSGKKSTAIGYGTQQPIAHAR
jgi:hypothetical protein